MVEYALDLKKWKKRKNAKRKLESVPESVFLPTDFNYYSDMSQKAMDIMSEFADIFEYVGKDEAYLDITAKSKESFDHAAHIGQQIKNTIREGTKLTCSVGITPNKLISKIASDFKKPDGLTVVRPENVSTFLEPLKIRDVPGIGKKTEVKLESMGFATIGQLRNADVFALQREFGRTTVNPSGFLKSDAIFDINLFGVMPTEHVSFVPSRMVFLICCPICAA